VAVTYSPAHLVIPPSHSFRLTLSEKAQKGNTAELISGSLSDVLAALHGKGCEQLYVDGGATIQRFYHRLTERRFIAACRFET
jgi:hypothetical protein